ncbi:MAG TPA: hypothetical protein PLP29_00970 [Candidatus Ozemobacteraceae bacterium]|nr:hypothetical protein [Candidatus Ozemobacteraceae bacterium]
MLEYTDNKVSSVYAVCQPQITYQKVKELQVTSPDITVVFDNDKGVLCRYNTPQPGGPIYIAVSPTEDPNTGPMICESNKNPFDVATSDASKPSEKAATPGKLDRDELKSVMMPDIFDWQTLDHDGKIALLKRIKKVWRAYGDETDANAIDAEALLEKLQFYSQAIIFDVACRAAGINAEPYEAMVNEEAK